MTNEYTFTSIVETEVLTEVPDGATVLVESDGKIKRVLNDRLGGVIKTATIKSNSYDLVLNGETIPDNFEYEYECIDMTFEQAWNAFESGKILNFNYFVTISETAIPGCCSHAEFVQYKEVGVKFIRINLCNDGRDLWWTSDGLSSVPPGPFM